MTAQPSDHYAVGPQPRPQPPARTLDAVTHAIETCGDPRVTADFERSLGHAWAAAREHNSLEPLIDLIDQWWPEATLWTINPDDARHANAGADRLLREGPSPEQRARHADHPEGMTRERATALWEQANGRPTVP